MTTLPPDLEAALTAFATQQDISRDEAIRRIVQEWVRTHGFLAEGRTRPGDEGTSLDDPHKPDPEFVQYPGYFKGSGSL